MINYILLACYAFIHFSLFTPEFEHEVNRTHSNHSFVKAEIDLEKSVIRWRGTKPTGSREGTLKFKGGELRFDAGEFVGGLFVADMKSIYNTDIPLHDKGARKNITEHLHEDFATALFPTATFYTEEGIPKGDNEIELKGQLSIRGITKPFQVTVVEVENQKKYRSEFTFNRFNWKIGEERSWLERKLVHADIEVVVEIYLK